MSAELLRRTAKKLREHADAASASPWEAHPDGLVWAERIGDPVSGSTEVEDANYIALMQPVVALALADWLDAAAVVVDANYGDEVDLLAEIDDDQTAQHAVIVARAILRESS